MKQRLPDYERAYLNSLPQNLVRDRVRDLAQGGWSLVAIAEAFSPPKTRSSIRAWALSKHTPSPHSHPPVPSVSSSLSSSFASTSTITAAENSGPRTRTPRRVYDPVNPKVPPAQKKKISQLAPLARRYRARTSPNGTYAKANQELTATCITLYRSGASVRELALAAGVTYRAMARRIGRYK